jgi:uncharacterized protein YecA (UPF0149 family)
MSDTEYMNGQHEILQHSSLPEAMLYAEKKLQEASIRSVKVFKIGRNEPCPCGSGKKYKNCCLKK